MPDLKRYRQKRDLGSTPEPFGEEAAFRRPAPGGARSFVVQQHAATRMHWDLRLEIDGVLVSWAVPKGPSLDSRERRFAAQTEDHPLEYASFEGIIPPGNYGAGAMIVWDRGVYHTVKGTPPGEGLVSGKLDLVFEGHKLRGRFALVRMKGEDGKSWLLLHKGPPPSEAAEVVESQPESVLSGLTIEELRDGVSRTEELLDCAREAGAEGGAKSAKGLRPMLAATADAPFSRDGWIFELKYDGVRVIAEKQGDEVTLWSRRGRNATATYPEVARAVGHLPAESFVLDGEIVALEPSGRTSFERLQRRFTQTDPKAIAQVQVEIPVLMYAFDLLSVGELDLRPLQLLERKQILARFAPRCGFVRFADHVEGDGQALFNAVEANDLEGIVAKQSDSRYEAGARSNRWLKIKVPHSAALAIVGYLPGKGSRTALGSLMLAWQRDGELVYAGNAGSGLDQQTIEELLPQLDAARIAAPAVAGTPERPPPGAVWVRPELVCEARYTEVTGAGLLRHPVFAGLLPDRTPADCPGPQAREALPEVLPPHAPAEPTLELSRLDKVFWPVEGYTKGDLLAYYEAVWPWLEPYLRDRPVVLTRYPDGIDGKYFYQKNAPEFTPDWALRQQIDGTDYFLCNDLRTLLYVINSGAIPLHVWSARRQSLERPDWLVLDLDPKQAPFADVVRIARHIHALLAELGAQHFCKTSGQDGLHVLLPLGGQLEHDQARTLAEVLARVVCADLPEIATIARPVAARGDKVYVDYLQNGRGKLIAGPFSVRPRPGAPVSTPLTWGQVTTRLDPVRWNIKTAVGRMLKHGDPMRELLGAPVDVDGLLAALGERLARGV